MPTLSSHLCSKPGLWITPPEKLSRMTSPKAENAS